MKITSLKINGFRNLKPLMLDFSDALFHVFAGPNGQGKTNILESIFLMAISKSFRAKKNEELIGFDCDFCSLRADFLRGDESSYNEFIITRELQKRALKINGLQKNAAEYIGNLNVVFFSPDDIGMIHLAPAMRRRYLDLLISQLDRDYLSLLLQYQHAVKQRNSLLRLIDDEKARSSELDFWDAQLSGFGLEIMRKRDCIINELDVFSSVFYSEVSGNRDSLRSVYMPSIENCQDADLYIEKLFKSREKDIVLGTTRFGPHRDDVEFLCNGRDMSLFASRGEWRSLVLTLKFAEIDLIKNKTGFSPVLLMDDVFSELDDQRQRFLFNSLEGVQTFVTTTHHEYCGVIKSDKRIYKVIDGNVV